MTNHSGSTWLFVLFAVLIVVSSIHTAMAKHYYQCCDPDCGGCFNGCCGDTIGAYCTGPRGPGRLVSNPTNNADWDDKTFCLVPMCIGGAASPTGTLTFEQQSEIANSLAPGFAPLGYEVVYATEEVPLAVSTGMAQDTLDLERITGEADLFEIPLGYSKSLASVPAGQYLIRLPNPGDGDIVLVLGPVEVWQKASVPTLTEWGLIVLVFVLLAIATWMVLKRRRVVTA